MIKKIAILQLVLCFIVSTIFWLTIGQNAAVTCVATSLLLAINLFGHYFFWRVVFYKKSIALGLLIIIFKYPLIAYSIWQMSKQSWVEPMGVLVSMLLFIISIVSVVLYTQKENSCISTGHN